MLNNLGIKKKIFFCRYRPNFSGGQKRLITILKPRYLAISSKLDFGEKRIHLKLSKAN